MWLAASTIMRIDPSPVTKPTPSSFNRDGRSVWIADSSERIWISGGGAFGVTGAVPLRSRLSCAFDVTQMSSYRMKDIATIIPSRTPGSHRRTSRKTSLRSRRSIGFLLGELEEDILERALAWHDRAGEELSLDQRAVERLAEVRTGIHVEAACGHADVAHSFDPPEDLGGALGLGHRDVVRASAARDLGDRSGGDDAALLDHDHAAAHELTLLK